MVKSQTSTSATIWQEKLPGHYWDKEGVKHVGILKPKISSSLGDGTSVKFYQNGQKIGNFGADEMASFVHGRDSFALIEHIMTSSVHEYGEDFAKVVETGSLTLYQHNYKKSHFMFNNLPVREVKSVYLVKKSGSEHTFVIKNKRTFEDNFLPLIEDDEKLTEHILAINKRDWVASLPRLVIKYNSQH